MRWRRPHPKRTGGAATRQAWSAEDTDAVRQAVDRAPSMTTPPPWSLEIHERAATLSEVSSPDLPTQDREGRDLALSFGAALTNLTLAIRNTGWAVEIRQELGPEHDDSQADRLTIVTCTHRQAPTATEGQRFRAMARQNQYRRPFHPQELSHVAREALETASRTPSVYPRWVTQAQASVLAALLADAGRAHRRDHRFLRDMSMWTTSRQESDAGPWAGPEPGESGGEEPAAGSSASMPRLPGERRLEALIAGESVLGLSTPADSHDDQVKAGEAMQQAWLTATSLGLVASAITRPLHLAQFRSGLREQLSLPGHPQVLLRFGHPTIVPGPRHP